MPKLMQSLQDCRRYWDLLTAKKRRRQIRTSLTEWGREAAVFPKLLSKDQVWHPRGKAAYLSGWTENFWWDVTPVTDRG
jgi:hypothetical protein